MAWCALLRRIQSIQVYDALSSKPSEAHLRSMFGGASVVARTWPEYRRPPPLQRPAAVVVHPQAAADGLEAHHAAVARPHVPQRFPDQLLQWVNGKLSKLQVDITTDR